MSCFFYKNRFYPQNMFLGACDKINIAPVLIQLSEEAYSIAPECFDAETRYFIFKFHYHPPYTKISEFPEMKRLQTEAISKTRFKEEYNGFIAIDISEWVGHSDEEHFENCLMFLKHMCGHWKYVFFTSGKFNEYELSETLKRLKEYIWLIEINNEGFEESDFSHSLYEEMSNKYKMNFSPSSQSMLKTIFNERKASDSEVVANMAQDMSIYFNGIKQVSKYSVSEYLNNKLTYGHFIMSKKEISMLNNYIAEKESKR